MGGGGLMDWREWLALGTVAIMLWALVLVLWGLILDSPFAG